MLGLLINFFGAFFIPFLIFPKKYFLVILAHAPKTAQQIQKCFFVNVS
jgi:hypothetical protein